MSSLYDVVINPYSRGLQILEHILSKGEAFTKEKGISEEEVMGWKLAPDMLPLTFQVQTVCNGVKNCLTRVLGIELPKVEDNEKTFSELHARIASTQEMLKAITPKQFEGKTDAEVVMTVRGVENKFTGMSYVQGMALPNFYFHITTLYMLFRHNGAPLGKMDFLKGADNA